MSNVTRMPGTEPLDEQASAYKKVRDATVCDESLSNAEKLGVLDLVRHEILTSMHNELREELE